MTSNVFWPPTEPDIYGPLIATSDVREAVKTTLQTWLPNYINETNDRRGLDLPGVQEWETLPEYRALPQGQSPAVMTTVLGTIGQPERHGDGSIRVHFNVQVSIVVYGTDWQPTEDTTGQYATAVVAALVQHPGLDGLATSVKWLSYRYVPVDHSSTRTLGTGQLHFDVEIPAFVNTDLGPATPQSSPFPAGLVESVDITINKEPL